jgi:hypothetical protein
MIEKARWAAAFQSWYNQTSLPEVRFALTLHAWTRYFSFPLYIVFFVFLLFFQTIKKKKKKKKKKKGEKDADFLFPYLDFQISYVILCDVSVLGALIILAFI